MPSGTLRLLRRSRSKWSPGCRWMRSEVTIVDGSKIQGPRRTSFKVRVIRCLISTGAGLLDMGRDVEWVCAFTLCRSIKYELDRSKFNVGLFLCHAWKYLWYNITTDCHDGTGRAYRYLDVAVNFKGLWHRVPIFLTCRDHATSGQAVCIWSLLGTWSRHILIPWWSGTLPCFSYPNTIELCIYTAIRFESTAESSELDNLIFRDSEV